MLARSFLIESSSKLLVTKTGIKARSSSILGRIRPFILELPALEWRKFYTFELEYLWSHLATLDRILFVASLEWGKGCIRTDLIKTLVSMATESTRWLIMMSPPFLGCFYPIVFNLMLRWAIVALWATCFNKYSSGALSSHLGHFGLSFSRFREIIPIL